MVHSLKVCVAMQMAKRRCADGNVAHACCAGSHHFVCCEGISTPNEEHSPHGNRNPLADVIAQASSAENPSWCTCSEEVRICSDLGYRQNVQLLAQLTTVIVKALS